MTDLVQPNAGSCFHPFRRAVGAPAGGGRLTWRMPQSVLVASVCLDCNHLGWVREEDLR